MVQKLKTNEVLGYVMFDEEIEKIKSTTCYISVSKAELKRGVYLELRDLSKDEYYIGQVIDGPYYPPTSINEDSKQKVQNAIYLVELTATIKNGVQTAVLSRPNPGTPVRTLESEKVQFFLGAAGDIELGRLSTQMDVSIGLDSSVLTRHLGIFGTTGSGKSNTIQVVMEEASEAGLAVLVFDVEGEYTRMDEPTEKLIDVLKEFNKTPKSIKDLNVYVPAQSKSLRPDAKRFGIKFTEINKDVFSEVAELTKMEKLYFMDLIKKVEEVAPVFREVTLKAVLDRLKKRLEAQADNPTLPEFIAEAHTSLYSKLSLIDRLGLIDTEYASINIEEIVVPGRISVIDFSDASDAIRNMVIADLLDKLFRFKIEHPETAKILIILEEAHNFISKEKRERMLATLMLILEIARRGRKRGICLGIVTQQPYHLPSELLELCNTRIMHRMSSTSNINVLKESTGNVPESLWDVLPSLGKGEAIIASPKYNRAVIARIRPVASKRIAVE
ncbi:MAG: ATP-binding protein [Candidatus Bathyarchaeia archaeon]